MLTILLLPALLLTATQSPIPDAVEVRPGVFVLRGAPDPGTCAALKQAHITHVIDLRRDTEPNLNCQAEASHLQDLGIHYIRYAISRTPPPGDFDFLHQLLRDLPRGSRVLLHCDDGNRAAAVACTWLVLDKGLPVEQALAIAHQAGLRFPETEAAVRKYLHSKGRV